jgi:hypothetical protein
MPKTKILVANFSLAPSELKVIPFNYGLGFDVKITEMTATSSGAFRFNFRLLGSVEWFATERMQSNAVFLGFIPFRFPVEFVVPAKNGIEIEAQNMTSSSNTIQILFIGYAI